MISVNKIQPTQIQPNNKISTPIRPKTDIYQFNNNENNLLTSFLSMMGKNNVASIAFGSGIEYATPMEKNRKVGVPKDGTWISERLMGTIHTEASNHIEKKRAWPEIKNINAWMISAETQNFMPVGGLAQVAVDLPNSFNRRFKTSPENKMTIVTPMYLNEGQGLNKFIEKDGKSVYLYKDKKIDVDKTATIKVPIFDEWKNGGEVVDLDVNIYEGTFGDSKYIFFYRADIFNIDPESEGTSNAYTKNKFGYSETIRFPFFSRCVYEYMKHLNNNPEENGEKIPNVVIMNDWHTGSLAPMMKYLAKCEQEHNEISGATAAYFDKTPTLFIAHNLAYQGSVYDTAQTPSAKAKVLGTIFGKYAKNIVEHSYSWDMAPWDKKNTILNHEDNVNQGLMGLCLADRVIPVSVNFGDELLKSGEMANGMIELLNARKYSGTYTPITNGYTKNRIMPSESFVNKLVDGTIKDINGDEKDIKGLKNPETSIDLEDFKLKPFAYNSIEDAKPQNKVQILNLVNKMLERERRLNDGNDGSLANIDSKRKYMIFQPNLTNLSDISETDLSKIPVMTFVGRVVEQKGMHDTFKQAYLQFAREYTQDKLKPESEQKYKNWEIPIVIAGGVFGAEDTPIYKQLEGLKEELRAINPKFADRFVLFKGYCNTNLLGMGSDFFLIPSNFEPCGLVQMEVMAKGVVPITTATGGLVSTIDQYKSGFLSTVHYDSLKNKLYPSNDSQNLPESNAMGYKQAIENALSTFTNKPNQMLKMQRTAMLKDFSWAKEGGALDKYISLMKTGSLVPKKPRILPYNIAPDAKDTIPYLVPDMEKSNIPLTTNTYWY